MTGDADAVEVDFVLALRDPKVRQHLARRGYIEGDTIRVGTDPLHACESGPASFVVWPDETVPGGWDGAAVSDAP